jgi:ribonuclease HII
VARSSRRGSSDRVIRSTPSWELELEARRSGAMRIAGIDEAGRGPLAGPVVAAAVVLPYGEEFDRLNDSKLLTPRIRERLFDQISDRARAVGVGVLSPRQIDKVNIYQATRLAMTEAIRNLSITPDYLLIDGPMSIDPPIAQRGVIKGDRLSCSIAAAAIIAKVTRDRIMTELHEKYPQYGFISHKGYATKAHKEAIRRFGPSPAHRMCFRGVKEYAQISLFDDHELH